MQVESQLKSLKYRNIQQTVRDVNAALGFYKDLRPRQKSNRMSRLQYTLEGTIPVSYKGNTYNIPLIIWLAENHPAQAPEVQVTPTSTMTIKVSPQVNAEGFVNVAYLKDWKQGKSDLSSLIQVLAIVFGESPPVFAKPRNQTATPPAQSSSGGYPPYPVSNMGMPQPYQPGPISYPPASTGAYNSTPYPSTGYSPYGPPTSQGTGYPPASGYPSYQMPYPPASSSSGTTGGYPPASYPPVSSYSGYGSGSGFSGNNSPAPSSGHGSNPQLKSSSNTYQLSDDEIKASLLSAVEDKMRRYCREMITVHKDEMSVLRNTQENLKAGQQQLDEFEQNLNSEMEECSKAISMLEIKIPELKLELEKRTKEDSCDPEDAIQTTAPLYRQLLAAYCEEQAIDDALYILGDGLTRQAIPLEVYLKKVRELSRRQFMQKALIQKCREKAGLSDIYT